MFKFFTNWYYRMRPPEMVSYWKEKEGVRAKITHARDGSLQMELEGEKYPFPALPRGPVLNSSIGKLKHTIKNMIFNAAWAEIEKVMSKSEMDMMPIHKCAPAIREIARVLDKMVEMEISDDMKGRMRLLRNVIVFIFQEDDAYRFRAQYFLSNLNQRKIKLSKADKYYARGKYWKVDLDRFDY